MNVFLWTKNFLKCSKHSKFVIHIFWHLSIVYQAFDLLLECVNQLSFVCDTFIELLCLTTDISECDKNLHCCDSNATCTYTNGSFTCSCNKGYTGNKTACSGE